MYQLAENKVPEGSVNSAQHYILSRLERLEEADRIEEELGEKVTIIATGGNAESIVSVCKRDVIYDGNLVLDGLNFIYKKNNK